MDLPTTVIYTLSLHDALPIYGVKTVRASRGGHVPSTTRVVVDLADRKSTRLNSSHVANSYVELCSDKTDNAGSMELADQHNEAIHPATETSVLPSASAPPSDGQSAPTVPKPAAASITGNVGNPVSTDNSGSMELADQHNEAIHPETETSVF